MSVRRGLVALLSLGIFLGAASLTAPAHAETAPQVSRATVVVAGFDSHTMTKLTGTLVRDPITVVGGARPIIVQFKAAAARIWTSAAPARSSRTGAFTVVETVRAGSWSWRVYVPKYGRFAAATSMPRVLIGKSLTTVSGFVTPISVVAGSSLSIPVKVIPGVRRPVQLQSRVTPAAPWITRSATTTDGHGWAVLRPTGTRVETHPWRAYAPATPTAFEGSSVVRTIAVTPGPAVTVDLSGVSSGTAGPRTVTVTLTDAFGNRATSYRGTMHFTSSDGSAVLPGDYTFTANDSGTHAFTNGVILSTATASSVTVTDIQNASLTATRSGNVSPGAVASLQLAGLTDAVAGAAQSVTVTARDAYGNIATGYSGTVHFSVPGGSSTVPNDYTFTPGVGTHTFASAVILTTAGTRSVTVADTVFSSLTASQNVTVSAGPAASLNLSGIGNGQIGARSVTVTALDSFSNVATSYHGTVHFSSTDAAALLPADYTFVLADAGSHVFAAGVTLNVIGDWSVTAADTVTESIHGTQSATLTAGPATHFVLVGLGDAAAGTAQSVQLTCLDSQGNTATSYRGTVHFTSTDSAATKPVDYTFTSNDNGVHTFTGIHFATAGSRALTATDSLNPSISGDEATIVTAGPTTHLEVTTPTTGTAGAGITVTVRSVDVYGNTTDAYRGTIRFTSTDGSATLPSNYTFTGGDSGQHAFTGVVLKTAGSQTVTATDTLTSSIAATSGNITVGGAPATQLQIASLVDSVAGVAQSVTVSARDTYGNLAGGYSGTVHFTSTDPNALVPGDFAFSPGTNSHTFVNGVTLKTAGTRTVSVADTVNGVINATSEGVAVSSAAAATVQMSGLTGMVAGGVQSPTVTLHDAYGNVAAGYRGTIHFTSTDGQAVLPINYTFTDGDSGLHAFHAGATLKSSGIQSITATDTVLVALSGSQSATISPGPAVSLTVAGITDGSVGTRSVTVTVRDDFANVADAYRGTVHFTSSDLLATLPDDYAFTQSDAGTHQFTMSLNSSGIQTVTVTDAANSLTGSQSASIAAAPTSHFVVTGLVDGKAGDSQSVTVVAVDTLGHTAGNYRGTISFASTDPIASLPTDYTFTAGDSGSHTFSADLILQTTGTHTITVADNANPAVTGTSASVTITSGDAVNLGTSELSGPVGNRIVVVTAVDAFGNTATSYRGKVHFTCTDGNAVLPSDYTFTALDGGSHTFVTGFAFPTLGTWSLTAFDNASGFGVARDFTIG